MSRDSSSNEDYVNRVIAEFLDARLAGDSPSPDQLFLDHPEIADDLNQFFLDHQWILSSQPMDDDTSVIQSTKTDRDIGTEATLSLNYLSGTRRDTPEVVPENIFGDFELVEEIARGGMGLVYKARQLSLNRVVALKMILSGQFAGREDVQRFYAEAEAAASLEHPGIVPVFEVGEHNGQHYFSMGYVEGESLAEKIADGPLPPIDAARYTRQVARAMAYAHDRGVIHRDLKPSNVLIDDNDEPRVTDFGLSKRVAGQSELTATGQVLGTPSFMPPEQAMGRTQEVAERSDVYSLGAILYCLLTARPPFQAATPIDTLSQVVNREPVAPRHLNPKTPADLETISLKCLEKVPQRRYPSAEALAEELARYLDGQPILARPISAPVRAVRWCRRNPVVAALTAAMAATLLIGIAVSTFFAFHAGHQAAVARAEKNRADKEATKAQRARDEATSKLRQSYLAQSRAGRWSGRTGRRFDGLTAIAKAAAIEPGPELRDEALACLALVDLRKTKQWKMKGMASRPEFTKDLSRYLWASRDGTVYLHRVSDNQMLRRLPMSHGRQVRGIVFRLSRDEKRLLIRYDIRGRYSLQVVDLQTFKPIWSKPRLHGSFAFDFSHDGRSLVVGGINGRISLHDFDTDSTVNLPGLKSSQRIETVEYHPTDQRVLVCSGSRAWIYSLVGRQIERTLKHSRRVFQAIWHPHGEFIATCHARFQAYIWNAKRGSTVRTCKGHQAEVVCASFHPAGKLLATSSWDGTSKWWETATANCEVTVSGRVVRFSSDGRSVAIRNNHTLSIWQIASGSECRRLFGHRGGKGPWSVDFHPNGDLLVSAGADGVRIWSRVADRQVAHIGFGDCHAAHFTPAGKAIVATGATGLTRWLFSWNEQTARLSIGEPQVIASRPLESSAISGDGSLLVSVYRNELVVFRPNARKSPRKLSGHRSLYSVAISPDKRWYATGTWHGRRQGIAVWNAKQEKVVKRMLGTGSHKVAFGPRNRWLVTSSADAYGFWRMGSWQLSHTVPRAKAGGRPGPIAFTSDGRIAAIAESRFQARLIEVATGNKIARLETPGRHPITCFDFSPDDQYLAVSSNDHVIHLWNLKQIRERLQTINLNW